MTTTIQSNVSTVTTPTVQALQLFELTKVTLNTSQITKAKLLCIMLDSFIVSSYHEDIIWGAIDDIFSKPQDESILAVHAVTFTGNRHESAKEDTFSSEDVLSFMSAKGIRPANLVQMILCLQNGNLSYHPKMIALGTLMELRRKKVVPSFYFHPQQGKWYIETRAYDAMHCETRERAENGGGGGKSDFPTLKGWNPENLFCGVSKL